MPFNRTLTANVTTLATVRTASASGDVVIGMRITNTGTAAIKASACITASAVNYNLIGDVSDNANSGAEIPVGSSLVVISGDIDKVVLNNGDTIRVVSSDTADVIISVLEN